MSIASKHFRKAVADNWHDWFGNTTPAAATEISNRMEQIYSLQMSKLQTTSDIFMRECDNQINHHINYLVSMGAIEAKSASERINKTISDVLIGIVRTAIVAAT